MGHSDEEPAGNGGVDHTGRTPRLAGRDRRARRRRRRRRPAQGGVRGTVALARQPVDEPGADGRRSGRPRPGDALPRDHRSDRTGPDLPGCGRLRPRVVREPDARRPHPRAHLPTHPACLSHPCTPASRPARSNARSPISLNRWITSRTVSSCAATSRAIAGTGVPDADAIMINARRTRIGSAPSSRVTTASCRAYPAARSVAAGDLPHWSPAARPYWLSLPLTAPATTNVIHRE